MWMDLEWTITYTYTIFIKLMRRTLNKNFQRTYSCDSELLKTTMSSFFFLFILFLDLTSARFSFNIESCLDFGSVTSENMQLMDILKWIYSARPVSNEGGFSSMQRLWREEEPCDNDRRQGKGDAQSWERPALGHQGALSAPAGGGPLEVAHMPSMASWGHGVTFLSFSFMGRLFVLSESMSSPSRQK